MSLRRIIDAPTESVCRALGHYPPGMMVYEPGTYEWTCDSCGAVTRFVVPHGPTLAAPQSTGAADELLW